MAHTVTVGLDGSRESETALDWAARESLRRAAQLDIVQVREAGPYPYSPLTDDLVERDWAEKTTREAAADLAHRYPALRISTHHYAGRPAKLLVSVSESSDLLVLGSRGLGAVTGFLVGSVALPTVAHVRCPVVVVRDRHREAEAPQDPSTGPVVLGLKLHEPADELFSFAFRTAERWSAPLRVAHGWGLPPVYEARPIPVPAQLVEELAEEKAEAVRKILAPWRSKFPHVEVTCQTNLGSQAPILLSATDDASLIVVGRRNRRSRFGTHLGTVAHAVLHHADAPVAVVPHD